jgi:hypothetical protein
MRTGIKLGGFAAAVAVAFAGAYGVGGAVGPFETGREPAAGHVMDSASADLTPAGLQVSAHGVTLSVLSKDIPAAAETAFAFRIDGPAGPLTAFRDNHEKPMHLIVVRRDLTGFQHVHPELGAGGVWRVPLTFAAAGQYRVFADFMTEDGTGVTLGTDVAVAGDYRPRPLPAPSATTTVDGYTVTAAGTLTPGRTSMVTLSISKDGRPVTDLEPYLGAYGHLVALRDGDLAYLHVHPEEGPPGPGIAFGVEVPTAGSYRLYLNFQHGGVVRTAELTAMGEGR